MYLHFTAVGLRAGEAGAPKKNHPNLRILFTLVPAMNRKTSALFLAVLLCQSATAHCESVKDALNHKYKKQVLALRSPFTSGDQKFDSAGHSLNPPPGGPWLVYGGIYVEKLNLSSDTLRLEGPRAALDNGKKGKTVVIRLSKSVRIDIHLDRPVNSADDAQAVLNRVFFLEGDASKHATPEFRRAEYGIPDTEIYDVGKDGMLPPRAIYTPGPQFSEEARRARLQGVVVLEVIVDKAGSVTRIKLVKPLGGDLDDNAMNGVKDWRFNPATQNGLPVAVRMNIEVGFHLY
jgi:TonB family protein